MLRWVRAFVDESIRHLPPPEYVMAGCVVRGEDLDDGRAAMTALLLRGQRRLHWRDESTARRRLVLDRIASLSLDIHVVRTSLHDPTKQERARALCLRRLLWVLDGSGVVEVAIEGRQQRNDQRDRRTILRSQKGGETSPALRYRFPRPDEEPLLWIADAIAGASIERTGRFDDVLTDLVTTRSDV